MAGNRIISASSITYRLWPHGVVRPGLFPSSPGQGPNGARTTRIGEGNGAALENLIDQLRNTFANLPSSSGTDPEFARSAAASSVASELNRCINQLDRQDADANRLAELDQFRGRDLGAAVIIRSVVD